MYKALFTFAKLPLLVTLNNDGIVSSGICSEADAAKWARVCSLQPVPNPLEKQYLTEVDCWLEDIASGEVPRKLPTIDTSSWTDFQRDVRIALAMTNPGVVMTYGQLGELAGHPDSARAVGSAMSSNPVPPFVPCHRVVPQSGGLGNYSGHGGNETKQALLDYEASLFAE